MTQYKIKHILKVRQAFRFVFSSSGKWTYANITLTLLNGFFPLVTMYMVKLIIDNTTLAAAAENKSTYFFYVLFIIIITGLISILGEICSNFSLLAKEQMSQAASDHVFDMLHKKSTELDLEYYETPEYHDMLYRARTEAPFRPPRIVNDVIQIIQNSVSIILTAGLLFYFHWSIAVVLIIATVPGILIRMKYAGHLFEWSKKVTPAERKSRYFNFILTSEKFVKEIRIYSLGNLLTGKFRDIRTQLRKERMQIILKRTTIEIVTQVSAAIAIFGSYIYIVYQTIFGLITIGDLVLFFLAFQKGLVYLKDLLSSLAGLYEDNMFLTNLFDFLTLKPKIKEADNTIVFPEIINKGFTLENISFKYPGNENNILSNISVEIKAGETVALVGDNGAGKSTLIKLICRLYDPVHGNILIDDIDLKQFKISELRNNISVLFQDFSQYNLSFEDNVCFGDLNASKRTEKLDDAIAKSGLNKVLESMPEKYSTILGTIFENSRELSIGEWQKVALARAFYKDSQIIILDEPTSSMDTFAEHEFYQNFKFLSANKTAIIVSHRFSTVRMADRIFVMEKGQIIESGSHEDLMKLNGNYATMYRLQADKYL